MAEAAPDILLDKVYETNNFSWLTEFYIRNQAGGFNVLMGSKRWKVYENYWQANRTKTFVAESGEIPFEVEVRYDRNGERYYFEKRGWIFLPWYLEFLRAPQEQKVVIGTPGTGKAQPLTSGVLTPGGWCRMGDIRKGDQVIGRDGRSYPVIGVYPQGVRHIYKVRFDDGSMVEADGDHLWLVTDRVTDRRQNITWHKRTTLEIAERMKSSKDHERRHFIPPTQPVEFNARQVPVDPYLLGLLLGDGGLTHHSPVITTEDQETLDAVLQALPDGFELSYNGQYDYRIIDTDKGPSVDRKKRKHIKSAKNNRLTQALRDLGVFGKDSYGKFIPDEYKFNTIDVRLAVLQGLLDTDGCPEGVGSDYCTTSRQLAEDVREIVLSLGGWTRLALKKTQWTHKGEKKTGAAYRLYVKLPTGMTPFRLPRKLAKLKKATKYENIARKIVLIEYDRDDYAQCIAVGSDEHLYVTDSYVVTHNTSQTGLAAMCHAATTPNFRFLNVAPTIYQSNLMVRAIRETCIDTPFWNTFLLPGKKGYREKPYATFGFKNGSTVEFMNVERNAANIQSWYGDWINCDEAGLLNKADEAGEEQLQSILIGLATRLRGTRPDGKPRMGWLSLISMAYPCDTLWNLYDLGQSVKGHYWSKTVLFDANPYLTEKDRQRFLRNVPPGQEKQWIDGLRPDKKGAEFSASMIANLFDCEPHEDAHIERNYSGLITEYVEPYRPGGTYCLAGDPGHGEPPYRNAPVILMLEVSKFPYVPARVVGFWWGHSGGSIMPFLSKFDEWVSAYKIIPPLRGYDSTASQKLLAELAWNSGEKAVIPLAFDAGKKWEYITSSKLLMSKNLIKAPNILEGFESQMRNYILPDKQLAQDIVSAFCMGCFLIQPLYKEAYPDVEEDSFQIEIVDSIAAAKAGRFHRTAAPRHFARIR